MQKSRRDGPCWIWGGKLKDQYGVMSDRQAHRVIYERVMGLALDRSTELHHRCNNPPCVNPWHMEEVQREAHERIHGKHGERCPAGHEYDQANTYEFVRKDGRRERHCRRCRRERHRERHGTGRTNKTRYNPTGD